MATDLAGCQRILAAETELGRRLITIAFMRRFDPGYLEMKATLASGYLGAPLVLHCVHRNALGWPGQPPEMLIAGSAVHEIDVVRWLLGEELTSVTVHRPRAST